MLVSFFTVLHPCFGVYMCICEGVFTDHFPPCFSKKGLLLPLQLTDLVSQASKLALRNPFSTTLYTDTTSGPPSPPGFYVDPGDINTLIG